MPLNGMSLGRVYTDDILTIHPRSKDDSFAVEIIHAVADKGPVWALELAGVVLLCDDSFSVELLKVVADKGTVLGLSLGGAVLLILLAKEVGVFFFWWARYAIKRYVILQDLCQQHTDH